MRLAAMPAWLPSSMGYLPGMAYSFPTTGVDDAEIVEGLGIAQPLSTITLKAPQLLAQHFGSIRKRFILSFDKGMGKTITYLTICKDEDRVVILCPKNAMLANRREILRHFPHWAKSFTFVRNQDKAKRKKLWAGDFKVFICTPATWLADMGSSAKSSGRIIPSWIATCAIVVDEYHKVLRRKTSKFFKTMKELGTAGRLILSSGSAGGKGPQDLWAALHICAPKFYTSYWSYINTHCLVTEGPFGKEIVGTQNVDAWRKATANHILHRRKDLKDYPPKTRQALEVEMEPWQQQIHDDLRGELMAEIGDSYLIAGNALSAAIKIRQFMICPKVFGPDLGWGAGLEGILADIQDAEMTHFVISTPFRDPIPWIEKFFADNGYHTERLMGGDACDADEMEKRIRRWTVKGGLMVQTIKFAESYELPAARQMYMLGYEYSAEQNSQAEDRIHRDIRVTPYPVDIYYVKHMNSYDERLIEAMSTGADNAYYLLDKPAKEIFR